MAPRKAVNKKDKTPTQVHSASYISIEQFLETARFVYPQLNAIVESGFRATLEGNQFFEDEQELKKKLEDYLGIKAK